MPFVTLEKKHSVKNRNIDDQHQKIFDAVNALHDATMAQKDKKVIGKLLENLVECTLHHFSEEEKIMQKAEYPGYKEHKKEHDELVRQIVNMMNGFINGSGVLSKSNLYFLKDWLYKHIIQSDLLYVDHLFYHAL